MSIKHTAVGAARAVYGVLEKTGLARQVHGQLARAAAASGLSVRATLHNGDVLHVDLSSTVGRSIWLRGRYDDALVGYLLDGLQPGDAFLDVGANVGYYTAMASRALGPEGVVFAVEPGLRALSLLSRSAADNGWSNVVLCSLAASARTTLLRFHAEQDSGLSRVSAQGEQVVGAVALDALLLPLLDGRSVGALKLDVELHELEALAGLREVFARTPPRRVLTEAHPAAGRPWLDALFGFFAERGYRAVEPVTRRPIDVADISATLWNVGFELA